MTMPGNRTSLEMKLACQNERVAVSRYPVMQNGAQYSSLRVSLGIEVTLRRSSIQLVHQDLPALQSFRPVSAFVAVVGRHPHFPHLQGRTR
jgi:hypothetical protein